jgi:hypothetical protein
MRFGAIMMLHSNIDVAISHRTKETLTGIFTARMQHQNQD